MLGAAIHPSGVLDVLVRRDDVDRSSWVLSTVVLGTGPVALVDIDRTMGEPQNVGSGDVLADADLAIYGWAAFVGLPASVELRAARSDAVGTWRTFEAIDRSPSEVIGPRGLATPSRSRFVTLETDGRLVARDPNGGDAWEAYLAASPSELLGIEVASLGGETWALLFHEVSAGLVDARVVVLERSAVLIGPTTVLEALAGPASMAVVGGEIWVAGFERTPTDLLESRLRIARRTAMLERLEPDRWVTGWGGSRPLGNSVLELGGAPWLFWLTLDLRYDTNPVIHALALEGDACGRRAGEAIVVSSRFLESPVVSMRAAARGDVVGVAFADGAAGTIDLVTLRTCP